MKQFQQLLPKNQTRPASRTMTGRLLRDCVPALLTGFLFSGAFLWQRPLPLAAAYIASLPMGLPAVFGTFGALGGYFLQCDGAEAALFAAMSLLMLAALAIFQGTRLPATSWFMPAMAAAVCALLGGVCLLSGAAEWSLWAARWLIAGFVTAALRRHHALLVPAGLTAGLAALPSPVPLGLAGAIALAYASDELVSAVLPALALSMSGFYPSAVLLLVLLPALVCRFRAKQLRPLTYLVLPCAVLLGSGTMSAANLGAVGLGILGGLVLRKSRLLAPLPVGAAEEAQYRLETAAQVLDTLSKQLPEKLPEPSAGEAAGIYDAAAERICRCCARFHRCWQHHAQETYQALAGASKRILERGTAHPEDFPQSFRNDCCHLDGFLTALNQELEGMLYRRRYRMQLRESRQVVAEEFSGIDAFLRAEQQPESRSVPQFQPLVGISTVGKNGNGAVGDRGACFAGRDTDSFVLLCDGMGTGAGASRLSAETVRLLERLLRSGLAPEAALKIFNGVELLRGTGCFTTVDLLHIDLSGGEAMLYKWGAAPSYLRDDAKVKKIGTATPPPGVGVGGDHLPERYQLSLKWGEMLVLVSDGAGREDTEALIASFRGQSPRELAALLIAGVPAEDDMTAVCVSLLPR